MQDRHRQCAEGWERGDPDSSLSPDSRKPDMEVGQRDGWASQCQEEIVDQDRSTENRVVTCDSRMEEAVSLLSCPGDIRFTTQTPAVRGQSSTHATCPGLFQKWETAFWKVPS